MNRREVERLYELFNTIYKIGYHGSVTLRQEGGSGIGTVLTATFPVTHNGIEGEFIATITDDTD